MITKHRNTFVIALSGILASVLYTLVYADGMPESGVNIAIAGVSFLAGALSALESVSPGRLFLGSLATWFSFAVQGAFFVEKTANGGILQGSIEGVIWFFVILLYSFMIFIGWVVANFLIWFALTAISKAPEV